MEGAALAEKRRYDQAISQAWHTEMFARTKRLKKLSSYLKDEGEQTNPVAGLTAMFKQLQAKGKFAKITQH
jgi:hypothetical protein